MIGDDIAAEAEDFGELLADNRRVDEPAENRDGQLINHAIGTDHAAGGRGIELVLMMPQRVWAAGPGGR